MWPVVDGTKILSILVYHVSFFYSYVDEDYDLVEQITIKGTSSNHSFKFNIYVCLIFIAWL